MKSKNNLQRNLFLFSIAVVTIPMIILYTITLSFFADWSFRQTSRYAYHNIENLSQSLDTAFSSLNELSLYVIANNDIRAYLSSPDSMKKYSQANAALMFLPFTSNYYINISVTPNSGKSLTAGRSQIHIVTDSQRRYADQLKGESFLALESDTAYLIRALQDINHITHVLGYIKIQVNLPDLKKLLTVPSDMPSTDYALIAGNDIMLCSDNLSSELSNQLIDIFSHSTNPSVNDEKLSFHRENFLLFSRPIADGKLIFTSLTQKSFLDNMHLVFTSLTAMLILSAFFVFTLTRYYTRQIFQPLNELGEVMSHFEEKDFGKSFHISGNNEITRLVTQFNLMCKRIDTLHREIYLNKIRIKEAEMDILQSEINPHFLYNTLDTIYWMSKTDQTWKIGEMVHSLAKLFRITLSQTPNGLFSILQEKEHIQCYLTIQKIRYQDQFSFEFYIDEEIQNCQVLKLLLQPLVENAIIHGVEPLGKGRIVINIYAEKEQQTLIYSIYNDGTPVDPKEMQELMNPQNPLLNHRGLAIRNVNSRIQLKFGPAYGLSFYTPSSGGVLAIVRQPLIVTSSADRNNTEKEENYDKSNDCR